MDKLRLPGVWALLKQSLVLYKQNFKNLTLIGLTIVGVGLVAGLPYYFILLSGKEESLAADLSMLALVPVVMILMIAVIVFQYITQLAFIKASIEYSNNRAASIEELYKSGLKNFWPAVWVTILYSLVIFVPSLFLWIPGVVLAIFTSFYLCVLFDTNERGLRALVVSFYYVKNNFWRVLWRGIGLSLWLLLAGLIIIVVLLLIKYAIDPSFFENLITVFRYHTPEAIAQLQQVSVAKQMISNGVIGIIVNILLYCFFMPFVFLYKALVYKYLKETKPTIPAPEQSKTIRGWFMGLSIAGLVFGILFMMLSLVAPVILGVTAASRIAKQKAESQIPMDLQQKKIEFKDQTSGKTPAVSTGKVLNNQDYVNKELGFSIKPPQGWLTQEGKTQLDGVIMSDASEEILTKAIQIQYFSGEFASSDEVATEMIKRILKNSPDVDSQSVSASKIYIGPRLTYIFTAKMPEVDGSIQYNLITHETGIYVVTAVWQNNLSAEDKQVISETISTFRTLK